MTRSSLAQRHPGERVVPFLLAASGALLALGLSLPIVELRRLTASESYSIVTGVLDLVAGGNVALGAVVFAFSFVFPIVKLCALVVVWRVPLDARRRLRTLERLETLGRWSMLDLFVVAILIGAVQLGMLSEASPRSGVYCFGAAVLVSMGSSLAIARLEPGALSRPEPGGPNPAWRRGVSVAALACFVAGLSLPLMTVDKWIFWSRRYSVLDASARMFEGGVLLGAFVVVFVVVLPALQLTAVALARWNVGVPRRASRAARWLSSWAMLDVFGLALLVVAVKLVDLAAVDLHAGFWLLLAAAGLSLVDALASRRAAARAKLGVPP